MNFSGSCNKEHPVILYDFQSTRKTDHPKTFLKDYSGVVVTDGYQVYHSLSKHGLDLQIAGCWIHAKRKFAELVKATGGETNQTVAAEAAKRISEIFRLDNQLNDLSREEREKQRLLMIKPKVDDFFV